GVASVARAGAVAPRARSVGHLAWDRRGVVGGTDLQWALEQSDRRKRLPGEREQREVVVRGAGARLPANAGDPLGLPVEESGAEVVRDLVDDREQIVVERDLTPGCVRVAV